MLPGLGLCVPCPCGLHLPPKTQNVLAKLVIERVPSVEMVRFVSSGTEACLSVLRLMRAYTKREKVRDLRMCRGCVCICVYVVACSCGEFLVASGGWACR